MCRNPPRLAETDPQLSGQAGLGRAVGPGRERFLVGGDVIATPLSDLVDELAA
jgi:hypothetical protein